MSNFLVEGLIVEGLAQCAAAVVPLLQNRRAQRLDWLGLAVEVARLGVGLTDDEGRRLDQWFQGLKASEFSSSHWAPDFLANTFAAVVFGPVDNPRERAKLLADVIWEAIGNSLGPEQRRQLATLLESRRNGEQLLAIAKQLE